MRLLGLLVVSLVLAACGGDFATIEPRNPTKAADGVVVTRADGSSYEITNAVATCYAAKQKPGLEVARLSAPGDVAPSNRHRAWLLVEVVPGTTGTYRLPLKERDFAAGPPDVTLLAVDPRRDNELSGAVDEARGWITVHESTCDPEPRLSIRVDARLGSELGLKPAEVRGGMASTGR